MTPKQRRDLGLVMRGFLCESERDELRASGFRVVQDHETRRCRVYAGCIPVCPLHALEIAERDRRRAS